MTNMNLNPLLKSAIGFDHLFDMLNNDMQQTNSYPPYNIEVLEDNRYMISMAVAGFKEDDIDITVQDGKLTVKGQKQNGQDKQERRFLHQGIAERSFTQTFELADHVKVKGASLEDGILSIGLVKEIPEAKKPKKININRQQGRSAIQDDDARNSVATDAEKEADKA